MLPEAIATLEAAIARLEAILGNIKKGDCSMATTPTVFKFRLQPIVAEIEWPIDLHLHVIPGQAVTCPPPYEPAPVPVIVAP